MEVLHIMLIKVENVANHWGLKKKNCTVYGENKQIIFKVPGWLMIKCRVTIGKGKIGLYLNFKI